MNGLRIAVTADPYLPVPPRLYGGIERVVDFLVRGLLDRGHEVTLFAHPESQTPAALVPYGCPPHTSRQARLRELAQVGLRLRRNRRDYDVVHSFGRLAALVPVLRDRRLAKVQSYQRNDLPVRSIRRAMRWAGASVRFTSCSARMLQDLPADVGPDSGGWTVIHNGVDLHTYAARSTVPPDAPLVFLGRIEAIKGVHHAIEIARRSQRRLVVAGNRPDDEVSNRYFETQVEPRIDGRDIKYVGPVDDVEKNELLGTASALLMPIDWEEPFGIVMAEALACGTPVVGFRRGSVPEVVRDGVNGFVCQNVDEAVEAVGQLGGLDRAAIRRDCEARFGHETLIDQYEAVYAELCGA